MRKRLILLWLVLLGAGVSLGGQAPSPERTVLRVTTRLVEVNVIVRDKKGAPVANLTRDDFILLEDGKPQTISIFSQESNALLPPAQPLPPDTFTNRLEQRGGVPTSVTIILLDGLNTPWSDHVQAKDEIVKFLQQLQPQDRVALYALGQRLRILHDFTNDAERLLAALRRWRSGPSAELAASEPAEPDTGLEEIDEWLRESSLEMARFYTRERVRKTLEALQIIALHVTGLPGRKNLIWVSGSFPLALGPETLQTASRRGLDWESYAAQAEETTRALNDANVAIYPVDARGLIPLPFVGARGSILRPGMSPQNPAMTRIHWTHDTMNLLADRTGGRAFYNTNDIQGAIRRAIDDSRLTYVLGYYPTHGKWDGKFRKIAVKVKQPGLQLRHRRGYYALAEEAAGKSQRIQLLAEAAWSPLEATGLGLVVRVERLGEGPGRRVKFSIAIDPREVRFESAEGEGIGFLDVVYVQQGAEGNILTDIGQTFRLRQVTPHGPGQPSILVERELELLPQTEQVRIIARDAGTAALGSVNIPVSQLLK